MEKLYREVKASERLPDKSGKYITKNRQMIRELQFDKEHEQWLEETKYGMIPAQITDWLEPVEPISEAKIDAIIDKMLVRLEKPCVSYAGARRSKITSIKWAVKAIADLLNKT